MTKSNLQRYICEKWEKDKQLHSSFATTKLYLGGGFEEESKSVLVEGSIVTPIHDLESTHEEADTRMIFHAYVADAYISNAGVNGCIIINSTDTDILALLLHYYKKLAYNRIMDGKMHCNKTS